jgi:PAS domain S-box-containing protein
VIVGPALPPDPERTTQPAPYGGKAEAFPGSGAQALDALPDVVFAIDASGMIRWVNAVVRRTLGYAPTDLVGTNVTDFVHPADVVAIAVALEHTADRQGLAQPMEIRVRSAEGAWRMVEILADNHLDVPGYERIVVVLRDLTERRRSESQLVDSPERLRLLLHSSTDVVILASTDGSIAFANAALTRLSRFDGDDSIGAQVESILVEERRADAREVLAEVRRTPGLVRRFDTILATDDDRGVPVEIVVSNHLDDPVLAGMILTCRDLSERVEHERTMRTALDQSHAATRATSALLERASHELRTPLNPIIGFTRVLRGRAGPRLTEVEHTYLDRIEQNAAHLLELVQDLLTASQAASGEIQVRMTDAGARGIIRVAVEAVTRTLPALPVNVSIEGPDIMLRTDPELLAQTLGHLIDNAVRWAGGNIVVRVVSTSGLISRIDVVDQGPGVDDEALDRIHGLFAEGDGRGGRPGLGLAVAALLAKTLGLQVAVSTRVGQGATFSVLFPSAPLDADTNGQWLLLTPWR